jgi:hypothetical protein
MGLPMNLSSANVACVATNATHGRHAFTILLLVDDLSADQHTVTPSYYARWKHTYMSQFDLIFTHTISTCKDYQINL